MNLPDHGANPHRLYEKLGMPLPKRILDFSENVHPFGPPAFIRERWNSMQNLITSYPDPDGEPFRSAAAEFHGVDPGRLVIGNGAAEIFTWLARRYHGKRVVLIEPAFSEYRKTLEAENVDIEVIQLSEKNGWRIDAAKIEQAALTSAAVYICNPHNPTGMLLQRQELAAIAEACAKARCELVLDEAFIDFSGEEHSLIPLQQSLPHVLIVRSMTKMYAIPGLRLGYALGTPEIVKELKQGAAHWNVNAISAQIGAGCLAEETYRNQVIKQAVNERSKMVDFFAEHGCRTTDSAANFLSFRLPPGKEADHFFTELLAKGMVLRHTKSFRGMDGQWFRIGMKSAVHMEELRGAITQWLQDN